MMLNVLLALGGLDEAPRAVPLLCAPLSCALELVREQEGQAE